MKEGPIMFSTPMVRATLEGRKSQTRRVLQPQPVRKVGPGGIFLKCPYGQPGDRLWVRESFTVNNDGAVCYRATHPLPKDRQWVPSIFMPRRASRITLEVVRVRVERLQAITEADAVQEGVAFTEPPPGAGSGQSEYDAPWGPIDQFIYLWDLLNAKRGFGWDKNPWVWAIEFKGQVRRRPNRGTRD
jgi:hypothetical protein